MSKLGFKHKTETINLMSETETLAPARKEKTYLIRNASYKGSIDIVNNMRAFCRGWGLHQPSMVKVVTGEYKQYKGITVDILAEA